MKSNWVYIALIAVLIVIATQFWDTTPKLLAPESGESSETKIFPYAMIENPHSKHFDTEGNLSYEFVAKKLRHFRVKLDTISPGDYTLLDAIEVTLHTPKSTWFVSADEGRLSDAGNVLTLKSNVRIWRPLDDGGTTELLTTELKILPNEKWVSTDEAVSLRAPQSHLEAVGMKVDLNTKHIQLLDNVRGSHEPI